MRLSISYTHTKRCLELFNFISIILKINWILTFILWLFSKFRLLRALIRNFSWKSSRNLIDFRPENGLAIANVAQEAKKYAVVHVNCLNFFYFCFTSFSKFWVFHLLNTQFMLPNQIFTFFSVFAKFQGKKVELFVATTIAKYIR